MTEPTAELDPRFSSPGATATPWAEAAGVLAGSEMFWLSTVRRDGRPHVAPLPTVWRDGALHFCTGPEEQKARNLEHDPRCVLTTGTNDMRSGLDVVVEGTAVRVTAEDRLRRLAELWKSQLDWDFEVRDAAFHQAAGGGTAHVFAVAPAKGLCFAKGEPYAQTRYRFPAS
jgi:general stress protein 26